MADTRNKKILQSVFAGFSSHAVKQAPKLSLNDEEKLKVIL